VNPKSALFEESTVKSATGKSATGKSATGKSTTGTSATGTSATGTSATGTSATGMHVTGIHATGRATWPVLRTLLQSRNAGILLTSLSLLVVAVRQPFTSSNNSTPAIVVALASWKSQDDDLKDEDIANEFLKEEQRLSQLAEPELRKEYQASVNQWRTEFSRLMQAHSAYYSQPEGEAGTWRYQFSDAKKRGEVARRKACQVAVHLAEKSTSELEPGFSSMLVNAMDSYLVFDQHQRGYRISKALYERGDRRPPLLGIMGYAAFCNNEFEEAQTLMSQAITGGYSMPEHFSVAFDLCDIEIKRMEKEKIAREQDQSADLPRIELLTSKGSMIIELFEDQAPNTVANFIYLTEQNFFNGQKFYEVSDSLINTGSPTNDPSGNAGYWIQSESEVEDRRPHLRGYLTLMVIQDSGTGSSQFGLLTKPMPNLDTLANTAFGRIIEGEVVLDLIERAGAKWEKAIAAPDSMIGPPDYIISAKVLRKRDHEYKPKTKTIDQ